MIELGNKEHISILEATVGMVFNYRCDVCISRSSGGKLLGGVIYEKFTGSSIQAHIAGFSPFWLNRDLLWVMLDYPFHQLKVNKVFAQVREDNNAALEFNRKLGFKELCRIDDVFPEGQSVVLSLTRDDCRWLSIKPRTLSRGQGSHG